MSRQLSKYLSRKLRFITVFAMGAVIFVSSFNFDVELNSGTRLNGNNIAFVFEYFFSNQLFTFAVPMFFLISGFLFFHNYENSVSGYFYKLKRRAYSLLLPYAIWATLSGLFIVLLAQFKFTNSLDAVRTSSEVLPNFFVYYVKPPADPLWFIRQLMLFTLLSPLIYILIKKLKWVALFVFCALWAFNISYIIDCNGLFYFSVGAAFAIFGDKKYIINTDGNRVGAVFFGLCWVGISVLNTFLATQHNDSVFFRIFTNELYKINEVLGIIAMWIGFDHIAKRITNKRGFIIASTHLFFVYAMHQPMMKILNQIAFSQEGSDTYIGRLAIYICLPISVGAICIITGMVLKRLCKPIHSALTGGRRK